MPKRTHTTNDKYRDERKLKRYKTEHDNVDDHDADEMEQCDQRTYDNSDDNDIDEEMAKISALFRSVVVTERNRAATPRWRAATPRWRAATPRHPATATASSVSPNNDPATGAQQKHPTYPMRTSVFPAKASKNASGGTPQVTAENRKPNINTPHGFR